MFRDYCWGQAENERSLALVADAIDSAGSVVVLGAGGGRLAIDLHDRLRPDSTIAVDFNPLLTTIAARVADGESLRLVEFPIAPRRLEDVAHERELRVTPGYRDGLAFVTADALRPPFADEAFDVVITPWLVDIVSENLAVFAARINRLLKPGGRWVNFGSLTFRSADPLDCLSFEEATEVIAEAGFSSPVAAENEIDYMRSPASRHARRETVVTMAMDKRTTIDAPPRYRALPDWIVSGKQAVPLSPAFETQAATTRIHAFIMSLIDGRRSLRDMAELMEQQGLMPRDDALESIRGFLIRMYDDSRRYSGY